MLSIGLTGSFGTGKSTVASMFSRLGAKVIDADKIVEQLLKPSGGCYRSIVRAFGRDIVSQGKINKKRLANIVFADKKKRRKLEKIIHPKVGKELRSQVSRLRRSRKYKVVVLDVPLLFESGLNRAVDVTVVVKANQASQIKRITKRMKITKAEVLKRINAQWPITKKTRLADYIIDNRGSLTQTRAQVKELWAQLSRNW